MVQPSCDGGLESGLGNSEFLGGGAQQDALEHVCDATLEDEPSRVSMSCGKLNRGWGCPWSPLGPRG